MTFEITLDMEALGEDDTILVRDEFGQYPDCEYAPKSMHDQLKVENEKLRELLRKLGHFEKFGCHECPYEERCAKSIYDVDCSMRLEIEKEMCELGIEVPE